MTHQTPTTTTKNVGKGKKISNEWQMCEYTGMVKETRIERVVIAMEKKSRDEKKRV